MTLPVPFQKLFPWSFLFRPQLAQQLGALSVQESVEEGKQRWESGRPDYMGKDSFENIMAYIDSKISK